MPCKRPYQHVLFLLGSILLSPFVFLYASEVIWTQSLLAPLGWMAGHFPATALFWLLATLFFLTLYGFLRRVYLAYMPISFFCLFFPYISYCKYSVNGAPLQLSDFSMVKTLGQIHSYASSQLRFSFASVFAIVLANAFLLLLFRLEKGAALPVPTGFLLGSVCLVVCLSAASPGVLQAAAVRLDESCLDQLDRNNQVGMMTGLYTAWAERHTTPAEPFDKDAEALSETFHTEATACLAEPAPPENAPDIVFIMSESFFDITRLPNLTFSQDPLPVFHALSEACTNGLCLSNTYGGGTGYVEMEAFTGLTTAFLREGDTLCTLDDSVYAALPSTVRHLRSLGYSTTALHTYNASLYNRTVIYPAIGFDRVLFDSDLPADTPKKGPYLSDDAFARTLISLYESRDKNAPCFLYGMSMENHQAYTPDKYPTSSGISLTSNRLSDQDKAITDALVTGLYDADASLGTLVDYFSTVDRPVMLVFVGDHLPSLNLADGESLYARLGYCNSRESGAWQGEELENMLSTDYLIWTNYDSSPAADHTESCTFLGLDMLKEAGVALGDYFTWLDTQVAPHLLLERPRLYAARDGSLSPAAPNPEAPWRTAYRNVERTLLYGGPSATAS